MDFLFIVLWQYGTIEGETVNAGFDSDGSSKGWEYYLQYSLELVSTLLRADWVCLEGWTAARAVVTCSDESESSIVLWLNGTIGVVFYHISATFLSHLPAKISDVLENKEYLFSVKDEPERRTYLHIA